MCSLREQSLRRALQVKPGVRRTVRDLKSAGGDPSSCGLRCAEYLPMGPPSPPAADSGPTATAEVAERTSGEVWPMLLGIAVHAAWQGCFGARSLFLGGQMVRLPRCEITSHAADPLSWFQLPGHPGGPGTGDWTLQRLVSQSRRSPYGVHHSVVPRGRTSVLVGHCVAHAGRASSMKGPTTGPSNKALHQTRRGGVLASRAVVEARLAGEGRCSTGTDGRAK